MEEKIPLPWNGVEPGESPTVVSFDMGTVIGWAVWSVHAESLVDPQVKILGNVDLWSHGQIDTHNTVSGEMAAIDECVQIVDGFPGAAVLMEDFILRMYSKGRELLAPVRLNAMMDYGLRRTLHVDFSHRQQPSEAKSTVTDERLKLWGFYQREGGLEHARDADRHAITFLRKAKDLKQGAGRRALWWPHLYGPGAPWYVPPRKGSNGAASGRMRPATLPPHLVAGSNGTAPPPDLQPVFRAPTRKRSAMR